jgi:hypothetical protein
MEGPRYRCGTDAAKAHRFGRSAAWCERSVGRVATQLPRFAPTVVPMNDPRGRHARPRRGKLTAATRETAPAGNVSLIVAELNTTRCKWCNDDLEHCHDSLVRHAAGDKHCMDPQCVVAVEAHHMVIACSDFGCGCALSAPATAATA